MQLTCAHNFVKKCDNFQAIVTLKLPEHLKLDDDTIAAVKTSGLIGDRFIELFPGLLLQWDDGNSTLNASLIIDNKTNKLATNGKDGFFEIVEDNW